MSSIQTRSPSPYLFLFNVPAHLAWVCVLCGIVSHTSRSFLVDHQFDTITASLIGALIVGVLANGFVQIFQGSGSRACFPRVLQNISAHDHEESKLLAELS
jgi:uncharacterized membrane protein YjjB (DUF3815 family)